MGETVCLGSYNLLTDIWLACCSGYRPADDTRIAFVLLAQASIPFFEPMADFKPSGTPTRRALPNLIFASRWLQLPLYLGLIAAQAVYVFHFWVELVHLLEAALGNPHALQQLVSSIGYKSDAPVTTLNETVIMLVVLGLIDVVMISNLLIMVIVGGYETFVSRMYLEDHPDQPEWLSHVNASVLKLSLIHI